MSATKQEIYELVIEPLKAGYTPRHNPDRDPKAFGELVDQLIEDIATNGYSVNALKWGVRAFRQDWTFARWPVFGELKTFLAVGVRLAGETEQVTEARPADPDRWADHIMRTPNGRTCIEHGHALSLYEWAQAHPGKTPNTADMVGVMEATKRQKANMEQLRASSNPLDRTLLRIGEGMEKRRIRIEVYYGPKQEWAA